MRDRQAMRPHHGRGELNRECELLGDHHLFSRKAFMKTLDEVLTKYGHNWLLESLKDQDCQVVHLVDVGALQDCLRGSPKVQGATFASGQSVPMFESDIIDFVENRKTAFEINQLGRAKRMETPWSTVI